MTSSELPIGTPWLQGLEEFLRREEVARVNAEESDPEPLALLFREFCATGALKLQIPREQGGLGTTKVEFARYRILLARYSGALSFLQAQHQVAVARLLRASDTSMLAKRLRSIATEGRSYGIGFVSPRRRPLSVKQEGTSFILSGEIPWITGHNYLDRVVSSFRFEDKDFVFEFPFSARSSAEGTLRLSAPLQVCVFQLLNTVSATLDDWRVDNSDILYAEPTNSPRRKEAHNSVYTLAGAAHALLDSVTQVPGLHSSLVKRLMHLRSELDGYCEILANDEHELTTSQLRARATELAHHCSHLARLGWGGRVLLQPHPVNRLCREIWQYDIAGLKPDDLNVIYPG